MALENCPACDHEVSDSAKRCPNCGKKLKTPFKDAAIIIGVATVAGALINLGHKLFNDEEPKD